MPILAETPLESLSGQWNGTVTLVQRGSCTLAGRARRHIEKVRLVVVVQTDGQFRARIELGGAGPSTAEVPLLSGQVDAAFRAKVKKSSKSSCPSGSHLLEVALEGEIRRAESGLFIHLSGEESWCPKEGCVFASDYVLWKKAV